MNRKSIVLSYLMFSAVWFQPDSLEVTTFKLTRRYDEFRWVLLTVQCLNRVVGQPNDECEF